MFTVSTIYSAKDFLALIYKHRIEASAYNEAFGKFRYESASRILELSMVCGWTRLLPDGIIELSERGHLIAPVSYQVALLMQLEDMIMNYTPTWASLLPKGREEAMRYLPDDAKQCFKEAGFDGNMSDERVEFWDRLALAYRNHTQVQLLETGRLGEKLSIRFETDRTRQKPKWQSIESAFAGYDLLSIIDSKIPRRLLIEVKATRSKIDYATFHVSQNEWSTAENSLEYCFHLWVLDDNPRLYVVDRSVVKDHIASNNGEGLWESTKIPFHSVVGSTKPHYIDMALLDGLKINLSTTSASTV